MGKYREADVRGWTAKRRIGSHSLRFGRLISLFIVCAYFFCFALFATQNVVQHLVVYLDILFFFGVRTWATFKSMQMSNAKYSRTFLSGRMSIAMSMSRLARSWKVFPGGSVFKCNCRNIPDS